MVNNWTEDLLLIRWSKKGIEMPEEQTDVTCIVCKIGKIVEVKTEEFDPATSPMIVGPGSRNQFQTRTSLHCGICGVVYQFLPKKIEEGPRHGTGSGSYTKDNRRAATRINASAVSHPQTSRRKR